MKHCIIHVFHGSTKLCFCFLDVFVDYLHKVAEEHIHSCIKTNSDDDPIFSSLATAEKENKKQNRKQFKTKDKKRK